jgi:Type II secretion system (T2SS), protein M subtype b
MMLLTRLMNAPIRLQKCAAALLLAVGFALALVLAASAFAFVGAKHAQLLDLRDNAGRLAQIAGMKSGLRSAKNDLAGADSKSLFLEAESLTIGRANLQSRVDAIARSNGLLLSSAGGLPDIEENGLKLIGLRIDLSGGYDAVQKAIVDLETTKPPLMVRELAVRLASGESGDRPLELAAQIKLFGAFRTTGMPESAVSQ